MARYTLIISDVAYAKLVILAGKRGVTLGKLLNEIINDYLKKHSVENVREK